MSLPETVRVSGRNPNGGMWSSTVALGNIVRANAEITPYIKDVLIRGGRSDLIAEVDRYNMKRASFSRIVSPIKKFFTSRPIVHKQPFKPLLSLPKAISIPNLFARKEPILRNYER